MTRKENAKKILSAAVVMLMFLNVSASADVLNYSEKQNDTYLEISGMAETEKNISIEVLKPGVYGEPGTSDVVYAKMLRAADLEEKDGKKSFSFKIPMIERNSDASLPTNNYTVIINGQDFEKSEKFTLKYVNPDDFDEVLSDLSENGMESFDDFTEFLNSSENGFVLGVDIIPENAEPDDVKKIMYNTLKEDMDAVDNPEDAKNLWKNSAIISLINDDKVEDISEYSDYLDLSDDEVLKWYNHIEEQEATKTLTEKLSKDEYESVGEFSKGFKEALILTVVKHPDGLNNIGLVLNDFSDITNIKKTGETEKYKKLSGDYESLDALLDAYKNLKSDDNGGGSSSGSSSSGKKSNATPIAMDSVTVTNSNEIGLRFIDLDTVPWAYEAISTLCDKGIISGRSETRFMPDELITREEFAKLLVVLAGFENETYKNHFADVPEEAWYVSYVNIAYEKGIANGQGEGFGVGQNITRQDMAVMLYNTLKTSGYSGNTTSAQFTDSDMISDYAKDAVSVLVNAGAVNGMGDGSFAPRGNATRAQAAKIIFGVLDILK